MYPLAGGTAVFLFDFESFTLVWGVGRDPIVSVAPLRFKTLDSQPGESNMGQVSTVFHDLEIFQKSTYILG